MKKKIAQIKILSPSIINEEFVTGGERQKSIFLERLGKLNSNIVYLQPTNFKDVMKISYKLSILYANLWYIWNILIKHWNQKMFLIQDYSHRFLLFSINCFLPMFRRRIKVIIFAQAFYFSSRNSKWKNLIDKKISKIFLKPATIIKTSGVAGKRMLIELGVSEEKIGVVYPALRDEFTNSYPTDYKQYSAYDMTKLLFVGRVNPIKGLEYLIEAVKILSYYDIRLTIIGDTKREPSYMEKLTNKICELDLIDRIVFPGLITDVNELLRHYESSKIFVLPSLWETSPAAILEAMCFGLPIVATNVGGIPEWVADGENGFLIPPKNSRLLADALLKLVKNPYLCEKMGKISFEKSSIFRKRTWEQAMNDYNDIFDMISLNN